MEEFEIFRTGKWTSDKGITKEYTEEDLDKLVENYNSEDPAPIVIGHPQTNAPAFGWIDKIKRVADRLIAVPKQLNEKFVDLVKTGAFKKRSVSFTPEFKLNHVGFLGAAAPAVEGLKEIQFNADVELLNFNLDLTEAYPQQEDESKPLITLAPEPNDDENAGSQLKNFSDSLKELNSIVGSLKQNFSKPALAQGEPSDDLLKKIHQRIDALQFSMQINDLDQKLNEKLAYGSLTPAMKNKIMNIIGFLQKQNFSNQEFSYEKYISDVKSLFSDFLESIPKIIYYENFAEKPTAENIKTDEFDQFNVDEDSLELHKKALQYLQSNTDVSYVEAINLISKQ